MKKVRIIFGIVCLVIAITLCTACIYYWKKLGCNDVLSLVAAVVFYSSVMAGLWFNFDQVIKESNQ